jgi:gluconolactonase
MNTDIRSFSSTFEPYLNCAGTLQILGTGFRFLEGPVWDAPNKRLLFSDIKGNAIYSWSDGHTGFAGPAGSAPPTRSECPGALHGPGIAIFKDNSYLTNGNTLDHQGRLISCEHGTSRLTRTSQDGKYEVLASYYEGKELNSPNDVIVRSDGLILFTDPPSGRSTGYGIPRPRQLDFQGVYALDPVSGELTLLIDDFEFPNGLCLSLDERILYVNDTRGAHIRAFPISGPGGKPSCERGTVFAEMPVLLPSQVQGSEPLQGKADGMKFDSTGTLFCTGPGGVLAYDNNGTLIGMIPIPEQAANFAWGGPDLKTLFITASTRLYSIHLGVAGLTAPPR